MAAQRQAEELINLNWESQNQNATCTIANHLQCYAGLRCAPHSVDLNHVALALLLLLLLLLPRLRLRLLQPLHMLYLLRRRPLPILLWSSVQLLTL